MKARPGQIQAFVKAVSDRLVDTSIRLDEPSLADGEWFIDVARGEFELNVAWRPSFGFGFFTQDQGYGDQPNEIYRKSDMAVSRLLQLHDEWSKNRPIRPTSLSQLRQLTGVGQAVLAEALSLNQPAISRFEKRDDVKLSTLVAYLGAMGGRLEMRVHFDDLDVSIALPETAG